MPSYAAADSTAVSLQGDFYLPRYASPDMTDSTSARESIKRWGMAFRLLWDVGVMGGLAVAFMLPGYAILVHSTDDVLRERNFYGVFRVGQDEGHR